LYFKYATSTSTDTRVCQYVERNIKFTYTESIAKTEDKIEDNQYKDITKMNVVTNIKDTISREGGGAININNSQNIYKKI